MMTEERRCPHCGALLVAQLGPPDSGWGEILVCENNECKYFLGSDKDIRYKPGDSPLGCRYAEDCEAGFRPFNMLAFRGVPSS